MEPTTLKLCAEASKCSVFWSTRAVEPYCLRTPQQMTVKARDGTTLYATLLLPEGNRRGERPADCESLWRTRRAHSDQQMARQPALRRVAGTARFCGAARRQSRHGRTRARLCAGRLSQLRPGAARGSTDRGGRGAGTVSATGPEALGWWAGAGAALSLFTPCRTRTASAPELRWRR